MGDKSNGIMRGAVLQLGDKSICFPHKSNGIMRKKQTRKRLLQCFLLTKTIKRRLLSYPFEVTKYKESILLSGTL